MNRPVAFIFIFCLFTNVFWSMSFSQSMDKGTTEETPFCCLPQQWCADFNVAMRGSRLVPYVSHSVQTICADYQRNISLHITDKKIWGRYGDKIIHHFNDLLTQTFCIPLTEEEKRIPWLGLPRCFYKMSSKASHPVLTYQPEAKCLKPFVSMWSTPLMTIWKKKIRNHGKFYDYVQENHLISAHLKRGPLVNDNSSSPYHQCLVQKFSIHKDHYASRTVGKYVSISIKARHVSQRNYATTTTFSPVANSLKTGKEFNATFSNITDRHCKSAPPMLDFKKMKVTSKIFA
jgi:hypothetical protein